MRSLVEGDTSLAGTIQVVDIDLEEDTSLEEDTNQEEDTVQEGTNLEEDISQEGIGPVEHTREVDMNLKEEGISLEDTGLVVGTTQVDIVLKEDTVLGEATKLDSQEVDVRLGNLGEVVNTVAATEEAEHIAKVEFLGVVEQQATAVEAIMFKCLGRLEVGLGINPEGLAALKESQLLGLPELEVDY